MHGSHWPSRVSTKGVDGMLQTCLLRKLGKRLGRLISFVVFMVIISNFFPTFVIRISFGEFIWLVQGFDLLHTILSIFDYIVKISFLGHFLCVRVHVAIVGDR